MGCKVLLQGKEEARTRNNNITKCKCYTEDKAVGGGVRGARCVSGMGGGEYLGNWQISRRYEYVMFCYGITMYG